MGKVKELQDAIYQEITLSEPLDSFLATFNVINANQRQPVSQQILGTAAALICLLDKWNLEVSQIMSEAHRLVFSGNYGNMHSIFKSLIYNNNKKEI